jgi:hypothetical protein
MKIQNNIKSIITVHGIIDNNHIMDTKGYTYPLFHYYNSNPILNYYNIKKVDTYKDPEGYYEILRIFYL